MARPRWNRIKSNRNYTYREAANLLGVHVRTIQNWRDAKELPVLDNQLPHLILGHDLAAFGKKLRTKRKVRTRSDQMFCLGCKAPRTPAFGEVDCILSGAPTGNLVALCPECASLMFKRVALGDLDCLQEKFTITFKQQDPTL